MSTVRERPESATREHRSAWLYVSLLGKEPLLEGISVDLDGVEVIEVGRAKTTEVERVGDRVVIRIADSELSSRHFELRAAPPGDAPGFQLDDHASTNGTYVFGGVASKSRAKDGRVTGRLLLTRDCCICAGSVAMHLVLAQASWGPRGLVTWARELARRSEGLATLVPSIARGMDSAVRLAATELPLTLIGEAGSGRTTIARALHAWSRRSTGPFVVINAGLVTGAAENFFCGVAAPALPGMFAAAAGGTLFVRDLGKMHPAGQDLLFRVLHGGQYLPVGATRPEAFAARMMFSLDPTDPAPSAELQRVTRDYELTVPALRDRMPDLGIIVARALRSTNRAPIQVGADAVRALVTYAFPGNLEQLASLVTTADVDAGVVHAKDLLLPTAASVDGEHRATTARMALLLRHMEDANGNISEVARRMKTSRSQIHRWLRKLGHPVADPHEPE